MNNPLRGNVSDSFVYEQSQKMMRPTQRLSYFVLVLASYFIVNILETYHVGLSDTWKIVISIIYLFLLSAFYYATGESLFEDIDRKLKRKGQFFKSPALPDYPPLCHEGFVYLKNKEGEDSSAYPVEFFGTKSGMDIDCNAVYSYTLKIGEREWHGSTSFYSEAIYRCLRQLEEEGLQTVAIKDKFGQYTWIRGEHYKESKLTKTLIQLRLILLKALVFICSVGLIYFLWRI